MPSGAVLEGRGRPLQPKSAGLPGITRQRVGLPLKIFRLNSLLLLLLLLRQFITELGGRGLGADGFGFRTIKIEGVFMASCSPGAPGAPADDPDGQGASGRWDRLPRLDSRRLG